MTGKTILHYRVIGQARDTLIPAVSGHFYESSVVLFVPLRVRARIEKKLHSFQMSRADCEIGWV